MVRAGSRRARGRRRRPIRIREVVTRRGGLCGFGLIGPPSGSCSTATPRPSIVVSERGWRGDLAVRTSITKRRACGSQPGRTARTAARAMVDIEARSPTIAGPGVTARRRSARARVGPRQACARFGVHCVRAGDDHRVPAHPRAVRRQDRTARCSSTAPPDSYRGPSSLLDRDRGGDPGR